MYRGRSVLPSTAPNAIQNVSPTGTFSSYFKTSTTNTGPLAVCAGPDGNVYYTKQGGIGRATPSGTINEYQVPSGDSSGIVNGPDGKLWFTMLDDAIGTFDPDNPAGGEGFISDDQMRVLNIAIRRATHEALGQVDIAHRAILQSHLRELRTEEQEALAAA